MSFYTIRVDLRSYAIVLVQPFSVYSMKDDEADKDLGIFRLRMASRYASHFILVSSIVRRALLVKSWGLESYFVIDAVDGDMFIQVKNLIQINRNNI